MNTRRWIVVITVLLAALVIAAWWGESTAGPALSHGAGSTSTTPSAQTGVYSIKILRDGTVLADYDIERLESIGTTTVVLQTGAETGPTLLDVLAAAGVTDFDEVTVIGMGIRDEGTLTIDRSSITPDTVLDIAKRGTCKIAGPNIPREQRVRDITEIRVR